MRNYTPLVVGALFGLFADAREPVDCERYCSDLHGILVEVQCVPGEPPICHCDLFLGNEPRPLPPHSTRHVDHVPSLRMDQ